MTMRTQWKTITLLLILALLFVIAGTYIWSYLSAKPAHTPSKPPADKSASKQLPAKQKQADETYVGKAVDVGGAFKILVPNGWRASVSTQPSFLAVMFARPSQITTLTYDKNTSPAVDYNGIPAWSGLTEHYFVRAITSPSQAFKPADHAEVTSESYTFQDGTSGTKYSVTKHAEEARKWGGLLKDSEWYGRVFVYQKQGKTIEAHLAYYPSTSIDVAFFEKVASTISL